jgi:hypothetical protein
MQTAMIVLGLAALGGATMAAIRLSGTPRPPTWLALAHGLIAAVGLILLGNVWMTDGVPWLAQVAFGVFILAALGGLTMFLGYHLRNRPLPILFVTGHGLVAVAAYVMLLTAHFRETP